MLQNCSVPSSTPSTYSRSPKRIFNGTTLMRLSVATVGRMSAAESVTTRIGTCSPRVRSVTEWDRFGDADAGELPQRGDAMDDDRLRRLAYRHAQLGRRPVDLHLHELHLVLLDVLLRRL